MSHLLFMDECGHDHKHLPFEVRGGLVIELSEVWHITQSIKKLEFACFGDHLSNYGSEIKATKLLEKKRFKWAASTDPMPREQRQILARSFLARTARGEQPPQDMWRAYAQASLEMARGIVRLLIRNNVYVFASMIPRGTNKRPSDVPDSLVRKDVTFLFERFFFYLEDQYSSGALVLDETDRVDDQRHLRRIERYFSAHAKGKEQARILLPSPLFIGSEMSYAIQAADVIIYMLATAYRPKHLDLGEPSRLDVAQLVGGLLPRLVYYSAREDLEGRQYRTESVFAVNDPWTQKKVKASRTEVVFRAPLRASLQNNYTHKNDPSID